jgi:hypothetical protein
MRVSALISTVAVLALAGEASGAERTMSAPPALEKLVNQKPATAKKSEPPIAAAHRALAKGEFAKARLIAEPLAEAGDPAAAHLLGYLYEKGLGVRADIGAALAFYGDAALEGNADAQLALGLIAFQGDGVWPDYERAAGWFRLASAQGDSRGAVRLGLMHAEGVGVAHDPVAAANLFAQAAAKGDPDGRFYLGLAWLKGEGMPQNTREAAKSFEAAAKAGHAEAAYHLALMHESTALGAPSTEKAAFYMASAANGGFPPAYAAMGLIVHRGDAEGVAADWFEKGARAGDPQAAFLYAVALYEGDGRARNIGLAVSLLDELIASKATPVPLRAQAQSLKAKIARTTAGPLTLRN